MVSFQGTKAWVHSTTFAPYRSRIIEAAPGTAKSPWAPSGWDDAKGGSHQDAVGAVTPRQGVKELLAAGERHHNANEWTPEDGLRVASVTFGVPF